MESIVSVIEKYCDDRLRKEILTIKDQLEKENISKEILDKVFNPKIQESSSSIFSRHQNEFFKNKPNNDPIANKFSVYDGGMLSSIGVEPTITSNNGDKSTISINSFNPALDVVMILNYSDRTNALLGDFRKTDRLKFKKDFLDGKLKFNGALFDKRFAGWIMYSSKVKEWDETENGLQKCGIEYLKITRNEFENPQIISSTNKNINQKKTEVENKSTSKEKLIEPNKSEIEDKSIKQKKTEEQKNANQSKITAEQKKITEQKNLDKQTQNKEQLKTKIDGKIQQKENQRETKKSEINKELNGIKINEFGNRELDDAFVVLNLPIGSKGEDVIIGVQDDEPKKGKKGLDTILALEGNVEEDAKTSGYKILSTEIVKVVYTKDKELAKKLQKILDSREEDKKEDNENCATASDYSSDSSSD